MTERPSPLVPLEVDLRDFAFMPLDVQRLRDSDLASEETPEACWAAVLLWCASWHQVPAGSIPDSDDWQAKHAGYKSQGRIAPAWRKVRTGALRGWVVCSDGRLYHPVIAEKANDAWRSKLRQRWGTECARIKKHNQRHAMSLPLPEFEAWLSSGCPQGQPLPVPGDTPPASPGSPDKNDSKGEGQGQGQGQGDSDSVPYGTGAAAAPPAVDNSPTAKGTDTARRAAWRDCGKWLMANGLAESTAREAMGKLLKDWPQVALDAMRTASTAPSTPNPVAYLNGIAKRLSEGAKSSLHPVPTAEETAAEAARRAEAAASPSPEARAKLAQLSGRAAA